MGRPVTIIVALTCLAGVARAKAPRSPAELYAQAIEAHGHGDRVAAAALLFRWLAGASRASENHDLAEHLLADDLAALGLYHAAIVREVSVARNRARPELLPEALDRLEAWTSRVPFDEGRVYDELLHDTDFGTVTGPAADWVAFHQGERDLKDGEERWAELRFDLISKQSPFRARARLLLAAAHLGQLDDAEVLNEFEAIEQDKTAPTDVRNSARIQAARMLYDHGRYKEALALYEAIELPELDPGRGETFLEQAWTLYHLGLGGRAMGLLAALDAPSFRHLFLPDKYLLRGFIYEDACQYLPAKRAARGLLLHYRASLDRIQKRQPLVDDPVLTAAALESGAPERAETFLQELLREQLRLQDYASAFSRSGLGAELSAFYAAAISEERRRREIDLEHGVEHVADLLLHDAQQVQLLDYEVGLALYRRHSATGQASPLVFQDGQAGKGEVAYPFDGEYWNDELLHYQFRLTNRCVEGATP